MTGVLGNQIVLLGNRQQMSPKIFLILPIFNEELNLPFLFSQILKSFTDKMETLEIIAVDDGSTDKSLNILKNYQELLPVNVISHETNRNLGCSIRDAINFIFKTFPGEKDAVVITMDSDNSHLVKQIFEMVPEFKKGNDIVIASRFQKGSVVEGVPFLRRLISNSANLFIRILFPVKNLKDYTSGYRGIKYEFLRETSEKYGKDFITRDDFSYNIEFIIKLTKLNPNVSEIPICLRYDFKKGKSKMKLMKTIIQYLKLIYRLKWKS